MSFDNYKEKLSLLLDVEELQMQKDIRNYDMKGVVFQQERGDRRFLILEVGRYSVILKASFFSRNNTDAEKSNFVLFIFLFIPERLFFFRPHCLL